MKEIQEYFHIEKPIIGMIHTKGTDDEDVFRRAKEEIDIYRQHHVDAVLVEPYFGTYPQVARVLEYLKNAQFGIPYGVNCLNVDAMGFELAIQYDCAFLQLDSVVGHVKPRDEPTLDAFFRLYRSRCQAFVMGGVRFKYQPVLSEHTVEEDLQIATTRCDGVCVTQDKTGQKTSLKKIITFRRTLGDFPLFVCAGVTPENIASQLQYADGAVVGSYFKQGHKDSGDLCPEYVQQLMDAVQLARNSH